MAENKILIGKLVTLTLIFLALAPFFTHIWDMNTLTTSLYLFHNGENVYKYYAEKSQELQEASGLPVFYEGYTYTITELLLFYPFYLVYQYFFDDPLPISTDNQYSLVTVDFSSDFMIYNLIIKLPLLMFFLGTFYLVEKESKSKFLQFLLYPLFITAVLGMMEIIVAFFLLVTVLAFVRKNYFVSGLAFGIAAFKLYSLIILPYILFVCIRDKTYKGLLIFLLGLTLINIPSIIYTLQDVSAFYTAIIEFNANRLGGGITPINVIWTIPSFYFNYYATQAYSILFIVSYAIILFFVARKVVKFEEGIVLIMLTLLMTAKVVNEQYLLSIFPLLLIMRNKVAKMLGAIALVFALIRVTPYYFATPVLRELTNYLEIMKDYYSFVGRFEVDFITKFTFFTIALLFVLTIFVFLLAHHRIFIRRYEEKPGLAKELKKEKMGNEPGK